MSTSLKVAIIGGGASGIIAGIEALDAGILPTLFEQRVELGGAWVEGPPGECTVSFDSLGRATASPAGNRGGDPAASGPMYPGLQTNVMAPLMQFRGLPFSADTPLYNPPERVATYLQDVAAPLGPRIKLHMQVTRIRWTDVSDGGDQRKWLVTFRACGSDACDEVTSEQFDLVLIANGHYDKPFIPAVEDLQSFAGEIVHSRWYRTADPYLGKSVVVVGNSASGYDIVRELAIASLRNRGNPSSAKQLYQSSRSASMAGMDYSDPTAPDWCREIVSTSAISRVEGNTVFFEDGQVANAVDVILFATGYLFSFPFAHSTDAPFNKYPLIKYENDSGAGHRPYNLDSRDLFYKDPSLALLCVQYLVIPFSLAQIQSRLFFSHHSPLRPSISLPFAPGTPDDAPDSHLPLVYGHMRQVAEQDKWLEEMGEGKVGHGKWDRTSMVEIGLRMGSKALRRAVLGY